MYVRDVAFSILTPSLYHSNSSVPFPSAAVVSVIVGIVVPSQTSVLPAILPAVKVTSSTTKL